MATSVSWPCPSPPPDAPGHLLSVRLTAGRTGFENLGGRRRRRRTAIRDAGDAATMRSADVAKPDRLGDRLYAVDAVELDRCRAQIGIDGVDGKAELFGDLFADTAIAGQLETRDLPFAEGFHRRVAPLVK